MNIVAGDFRVDDSNLLVQKERTQILDLIQTKIDFCKQNQQEMYACMLLQLVKEIERLPEIQDAQDSNSIMVDFMLRSNQED